MFNEKLVISPEPGKQGGIPVHQFLLDVPGSDEIVIEGFNFDRHVSFRSFSRFARRRITNESVNAV